MSDENKPEKTFLVGRDNDKLNRCPDCNKLLPLNKTSSDDCKFCNRKREEEAKLKEEQRLEADKARKRQAIMQLWEQGVVTEWMLRDYQLEVRDHIIDTENTDIIPIVYPRQHGKTYTMCAIADELCRQNPNYRVTFVAPVQNQARNIAKFTMREILETCPVHLKPTFKTQENMYVYENGSVFEILGNNAGRIEKARGGKSNLIILDEVGFFDDLDYSVRSVLYPRLTTTNGTIVMISTPPRSAGHPFADFVTRAKYNGSLLVKSIWECNNFTIEEIERIASEYGGYDSVDFRREYGSEFITDAELAVIPEAIEADEFDRRFVKEFNRPPFYDTYVSMDLGFKDFTGLLFGLYDFRTAKLFIEDELLIKGAENLRTDKIASQITDKEEILWGNPYSEDPVQPFKRISDIDPLTLNDLYLQHGIHFQATNKDTLTAMVNELRLWFSQDKIEIHPRCVELIFQVKNATFKDSNKKTFDRSARAGHYDLVAALMYLVRNVSKHHNPYPRDYDLRLGDMNTPFVSPKWNSKNPDYKQQLMSAFGVKKRKKR